MANPLQADSDIGTLSHVDLGRPQEESMSMGHGTEVRRSVSSQLVGARGNCSSASGSPGGIKEAPSNSLTTNSQIIGGGHSDCWGFNGLSLGGPEFIASE